MTHSMPSQNFAASRAAAPLARAAALVALLALAACGADAPTDDEVAAAEAAERGRAIPVDVYEVQTAPFQDVVQLTGTVEAPDDATLSAEASGTVRSLLPLGTAVARGQAVAQIDAGLAGAGVQQAEAQVSAARAQLDLAEDQFRRQEPLYRDSIISPLEFQSVRAQAASARAEVARAEASLAQAREQLSRTRVIAPFGGIVERHMVERGEQVAPGTPVARIVSTARVKVTAGVPERYAGDIRAGTPVLITPQAYGLPPRRAQVTFVGQAIDAQSRTFPIEVMMDNPGLELKPQMLVRLEVTRRELADVLAIPLAAVVRDEDGPTVYVVETRDGASRATSRRVALGATSGDRVVVESGLSAGELVITRGQNTVATGDIVRITEHRTAVVSTIE
jgi:membrane fusion protein, multidrug efflux system